MFENINQESNLQHIKILSNRHMMCTNKK